MRGEADFSASRLLSEIDDLDLSSAYRPPPELENYRRFYGFHSDVDHYIGRIKTERYRLVAQAFVPEPCKGTIALCHGYYDHTGLYVYLIEHLVERGWAVIVLDLPGHGLSSGDRVTIDDFDLYVEAFANLFSSPAFRDSGLAPVSQVVGQSLGGSVVLEYLEQHPQHAFDQVVLLAPLVRPYLWGLNRFVFWVAKFTISSRKRVITNNADNEEFIALQHVDPLQAHILPVQWVKAMVAWMHRFVGYAPRKDFQPVVVQGHADKTVDWTYNLKVLRKRFEPVVLELPAARHHLVNESGPLREQMWAWLDETCRW